MKRTKQFYLAIIIICLIVIGFSTYFTLGGFDPVEVFVMKGTGRTVIGKEYIEAYDYDAFGKKMKETRAAIDSGRLKGMLTVVMYEDERIGKDSVHYFLGASVDEISDVLRLPAGYDYVEFRTNKLFKVFLTQHPLVLPSPQEIRELAQVKAIEEGTVLQPFSFEMYYEDESLSIEFWSK